MNERRDSLQAWIELLADELGIRADDIDVGSVLDLARDAAHQVERPAAPITTFMAGYAAGLRGGGRSELAAAIGAASALTMTAPAEQPR